MKIIRILFLLLIFSFSECPAQEKTPVAVKGTIDLRKIARDNNFTIKLNGQWEFYWKKMLHPHDFSVTNKIKPDYYGRVPSYWTDYPSDSVKTAGIGFATYRLILLLPSGFRLPIGFNMPVFDSSYDIYVDGKYLGGNGIPGKSTKETEPWYERNLFRADPASDTMSIIINVSNFDHRRGGFWLPLEIGTLTEIQKQYTGSVTTDWVIISLLFSFSLFFLFFFIMYPRDLLSVFFSLAVFGLALRPMFTSNFLILSIVKMDWNWIIRCEYTGLYLIIIGWYWFAVNLYPSKYFRVLTWIITIIMLVSAILTLLLPVTIFSYSTFIYYPALVLMIIYALANNIMGIFKKNTADYIYFSAFILLSYGVLHDVLVSLGKSVSFSGYILSYILVIFVFIQAAMLLYKWVKTYSEKEKLHNELEYMNVNLGMLVDERTREINSRKEEIEKQNLRIALQNKQLSETIQFKNKIFSVIAHDLRSPVVNILYMLNLLKEEEFKVKYDEFANSGIQYAQQVINLLENMLVWGRGQEEKIKFSPGHYDLADIVLTNLSIFKETADKKDISMNFTQIGNSKAYFDKDLLDIIIRNLLSNAIKFTSRGGRISILLKNKTLTGEGIIIKVCDNGIGIPPARQKYLFTAEEVVSSPGTENEKGTGIGLTLCHELINLNNGTISVESKEGEGTCFAVTLPVHK
jgi:signal transduction histidine kinase